MNFSLPGQGGRRTQELQEDQEASLGSGVMWACLSCAKIVWESCKCQGWEFQGLLQGALYLPLPTFKVTITSLRLAFPSRRHSVSSLLFFVFIQCPCGKYSNRCFLNKWQITLTQLRTNSYVLNQFQHIIYWAWTTSSILWEERNIKTNEKDFGDHTIKHLFWEKLPTSDNPLGNRRSF